MTQYYKPYTNEISEYKHIHRALLNTSTYTSKEQPIAFFPKSVYCF